MLRHPTLLTLLSILPLTLATSMSADRIEHRGIAFWLYHFAELFRDRLDCPDALYLDGDISYVYIRGETPPIRETN